jgi:hypothetical protein
MTGTATATRRRTAAIHLQQRDIDGLVLCAEHAGAPYDLLATALGVEPARLRGIVARWRRAGFAATGPIGPGPAWCWLTPYGMEAAGFGYPAGPPRLARLAHLRAVLAARLWLQSHPALDWEHARPWWQSERRIRRKGPWAGTHLPDAEIHWPHDTGSPYADQIWAIEVELTPKHADRAAAIMTSLTAAGYHRVAYLTAPAARPLITRCAAALPAGHALVTVDDLPADAYTPGM